MSRQTLLIAVVSDQAHTAEAEPVTVDVDRDRVSLILDDGRIVTFDRTELEQAVSDEQAALRRAA